MKQQLLIVWFVFLVFLALANGVPPGPGHKRSQTVLDSRECTLGPSYWCQNLTAASDCNAVKHCIQTVWVHQELSPDRSSVCQTCLDMVKQARDQLESNDTQELIKQVFEGTCALIHVKEIIKVCDKIADNYIPDLIDTLASEMNPQVVCSVAGLCNNAKMIEADDDKNRQDIGDKTCEGCHKVVDIMENRFAKMSRDEVLQAFLRVCGQTASLSDACSNIVLTYFTEIYNHLKNNFNSNNICLMSGECSTNFHKHAPTNVEITSISHIGYVPVGATPKDDLPCDLCEQLVGHLRDLLVANTTELEFKKVLEGLCKQTKSFKAECLGLVDEYYAPAYQFLIQELNASEVCIEMGICNGTNIFSDSAPIAPLVPIDQMLEITPSPSKPKIIKISMDKAGASVKVEQTVDVDQQLPIELLVPPHNVQVIYNSEVCVFCEYFLHYLQQVITSPKGEKEIKEVIDAACQKLPPNVNSTCVEFVDIYEPALVAIFAQEIDPSQVCPLLKVCPSQDADSKDVEVFMHTGSEGSKCPLCLLAVQQLEEMIDNERTRDNVEKAVGKLCSKLPGNLVNDCDKLVMRYSETLIHAIMERLTPQEVCDSIELCTKVNTATSDGSKCPLCLFAVQQLEEMVKNEKTKENIENALDKLCAHLSGEMAQECNDFVHTYTDELVEMLIADLTPQEVCVYLKLCSNGSFAVDDIVSSGGDTRTNVIIDYTINGRSSEEISSGPQCVLCEFIMSKIQQELKDNKTEADIKRTVNNICNHLPKTIGDECHSFVEQYADMVIQLLIEATVPSEICRVIHLCDGGKFEEVKVQIFDCAICKALVEVIEKILANPKTDHQIDHVLEKACRALPKHERNKCKNIIEKYGKTIFDLIIHHADKGKICREIQLCGSSPFGEDGVEISPPKQLDGYGKTRLLV